MQALEEVQPASTPSPSTPTALTPTHSSAPRRPPRKSTLTQQQKNQKRQRATQEQLMTLEVEFNKNPTPTAAVRTAFVWNNAGQALTTLQTRKDKEQREEDD
jgi:hypothetical protein